MKVLVCGGRNFSDWRLLADALERLHTEQPFSLVIAGGASGADDLGVRWAQWKKLPVCVFPANWKHLGKAAGMTRNRHMFEFGSPDLVVAFPGGRGTEGMVKIASEGRCQVIRP